MIETPDVVFMGHFVNVLWQFGIFALQLLLYLEVP